MTKTMTALLFLVLAGPEPALGQQVNIAAVTTSSAAWKAAGALDWEDASLNGEAAIAIDPGKRFQEILGFGAAMTDASAFVIGRLPEAAKTAVLRDVFTKEGLGLRLCRIPVGASDYARRVFSYNDHPGDAGLKRFSIIEDRDYLIPMLKAARRLNPGLFLFSSPWSPPGWMKTSATMLGGRMRADFISLYARYYLRYLKEYARAGIAVDALTPQNEPGTDQNGKMPACIWDENDEAAFVAELGPLLRAANLATSIWIHDHNYDLWRRPDKILKSAAARPHVAGVAFHGYGGTADMMSRLHEAHPEVPIHWTEGGPFLGADYADYLKWGRTITEALRHWSRSFTAWNLALDEKGRPNIGPYDCGGLITIDSRTGEVSRSGQYWAIGHFSRYLKRGAVRVASQGGPEGVSHAAFLNPGGELVAVMTNEGPARAVLLKTGGRSVALALPERSMVTILWPAASVSARPAPGRNRASGR